MATKAPAAPSARERLLAAASELFYAEGVHTVGIDRVIERAGVAKASLYNTFGSKDELVRAYLEGRHAQTSERITRYLERYSTPRERLLGVFEAQGELFAAPGFRGCAFVSASAESPGELVEQAASDYRGWVRTLLVDLAREAGVAAPETLGRQLHMIYDGASLSARMDHDPTASVAARAAAETLLDAALAAGALILAGLAACGAYCRLVDSDAGSGLTLPTGVRLASRGQVAAAWFLGLALFIATAGIGYLAWSVFTWRQGRSPAQRMLGLRCWLPLAGGWPGAGTWRCAQISGACLNGQLLAGVFVWLFGAPPAVGRRRLRRHRGRLPNRCSACGVGCHCTAGCGAPGLAVRQISGAGLNGQLLSGASVWLFGEPLRSIG